MTGTASKAATRAATQDHAQSRAALWAFTPHTAVHMQAHALHASPPRGSPAQPHGPCKHRLHKARQNGSPAQPQGPCQQNAGTKQGRGSSHDSHKVHAVRMHYTQAHRGAVRKAQPAKGHVDGPHLAASTICGDAYVESMQATPMQVEADVQDVSMSTMRPRSRAAVGSGGPRSRKGAPWFNHGAIKGRWHLKVAQGCKETRPGACRWATAERTLGHAYRQGARASVGPAGGLGWLHGTVLALHNRRPRPAVVGATLTHGGIGASGGRSGCCCHRPRRRCRGRRRCRCIGCGSRTR
jgi:hypothetical protein